MTKISGLSIFLCKKHFSFRDPVRVENHKTVQRRFPVKDRPRPSLADVLHRKPNQFQHRFVRAKRSPRFRHLPQRVIQRLDRIRCVDHLANLFRVSEEWNDVIPILLPRFTDGRVALIPPLAELLQLQSCFLFRRRRVNLAQLCRNLLARFPGHEPQ